MLKRRENVEGRLALRQHLHAVARARDDGLARRVVRHLLHRNAGNYLALRYLRALVHGEIDAVVHRPRHRRGPFLVRDNLVREALADEAMRHWIRRAGCELDPGALLPLKLNHHLTVSDDAPDLGLARAFEVQAHVMHEDLNLAVIVKTRVLALGRLVDRVA